MMKSRMLSLTVALLSILAVSLIHRSSALYIETEKSFTTVPVVIDSDGGPDDAMGLLLYLWHESNPLAKPAYGFFKGTCPRLVAITTVTGNTGVQNATRNLRKTLSIAAREDIPVYMGADDGLAIERRHNVFYGEDGFGDFLPPLTPDPNAVNDAVSKLVQLAKEYNRSLVIICLGPLTNLALAQKMDPKFLSRIRKIVVMGGTAWGLGNISPGVEFNIGRDPEAAEVVFREHPASLSENILVMPIDPTIAYSISKTWREKVLGRLNSKRITFLNKAERKYIDDSADWAQADPQAVAVALWDDLITDSFETRVVVETAGVHARGAFLLDYRANSSTQNTLMVKNISIPAYEDLLLMAFKD